MTTVLFVLVAAGSIGFGCAVLLCAHLVGWKRDGRRPLDVPALRVATPGDGTGLSGY